jgi:5'-3' exonuclease
MEIILFEKEKLEAIDPNLITPRSPFMCVLVLELQYRVQSDIEGLGGCQGVDSTIYLVNHSVGFEIFLLLIWIALVSFCKLVFSESNVPSEGEQDHVINI